MVNMLNIKNVDIKKVIEKAIADTKEELNNLTTDRTCMIYTSMLYDKLKKENILCYVIDTLLDMNLNYQHRFVLVPYEKNMHYIVDLTYKQFVFDEKFNDMYDKGYQLLSNDDYKRYVEKIANIKKKSR